MANFIKTFFQNLRKDTESLNQIVILQKDIQTKNSIIENNQKIIDALKQELIAKADVKNVKNLKEEELNNKYPKADIKYGGRSLPFSTQKCEVPVNVLITPDDFQILNDLNKWGLMRGDVVKIYKKINQEYYKYKTDNVTWGVDEVWEFPFESRLRFNEGLDCDSWAILQVSYYIAAGFPEWKVRCVAGITPNNIGHLTVYIYSEVDNKWHHLNSTYGLIFDKLEQYPTHESAESGDDSIGIKTVWFSFNNIFSWHVFKTEESAKSFKKKKGDIVIN